MSGKKLNDGLLATTNDTLYTSGKHVKTVPAHLSIEDADGSNFVHVLAKDLSLDSKVVSIVGDIQALAGAADCSIGFWVDDGAGGLTTISSTAHRVLVSSEDLSTAHPYGDLLDLNSSLDRKESIGELIGLSNENRPENIYLGLWFSNASTAGSQKVNLAVNFVNGTSR